MVKLLLLAALVAVVYFWLRGGTARRKLMPLSEARDLLGVSETDDADAIRAAHRRLIAKVHPDAGGTPELARRTNAARDALLTELARRPRD